jgi:hypothetical protein
MSRRLVLKNIGQELTPTCNIESMENNVFDLRGVFHKESNA